MLARQTTLDVPAHLRSEVLSVARSWLARGEISEETANAARRALGELHIQEHSFAPFADRVWELRANLTVYDAWYVALAEALGTTLVTADQRLTRAPGPRCEVVDARTFAPR